MTRPLAPHRMDAWRAGVWRAVGNLTYGSDQTIPRFDTLPSPVLVDIVGRGLVLEMRTRADVDAWVKHLKLPEPRVTTCNVYRSVATYTRRTERGWLDADRICVMTSGPPL